MDSSLLELLSRDMKTKTKNKDQPTKNHKSNGKYNTYHGPLSQKWVDERYRSLI